MMLARRVEPDYPDGGHTVPDRTMDALDAMNELELRVEAFEQVLAEAREEMKSGEWRTISLADRMQERSDLVLRDEPDSLLGAALREFAEEIRKPR